MSSVLHGACREDGIRRCLENRTGELIKILFLTLADQIQMGWPDAFTLAVTSIVWGVVMWRVFSR